MNPYAFHGGSASPTMGSGFQVFPGSEKVKPDTTGVNSSHGDCQNTVTYLEKWIFGHSRWAVSELSANEKGVASFRQK